MSHGEELNTINQPYLLTYKYTCSNLNPKDDQQIKGSFQIGEADGRWYLKVVEGGDTQFESLYWKGKTFRQETSDPHRKDSSYQSSFVGDGFKPNPTFNLYLPFNFHNFRVFFPHKSALHHDSRPEVQKVFDEQYRWGNIAVGTEREGQSATITIDSNGGTLTIGHGDHVGESYKYTSETQGLGVRIPKNIEYTINDYSPGADVTSPQKHYSLALETVESGKSTSVPVIEDLLERGQNVTYIGDDRSTATVVFEPANGSFDEQLAKQQVHRLKPTPQKPKSSYLPYVALVILGIGALSIFIWLRRRA